MFHIFQEKIRLLKLRRYLPRNPMHNDIFLVEFPKSGITWISFIISNIELKRRNLGDFPTFFNIHQYIPDIHQLRGASINRFFHPTFIKSHSPYNPYYFHVVYILRNPVDVMVSYYNHELFLGFKGDFHTFVKDENLGIGAWVRHVKGWLLRRPDAQRIHLMKYEELLEDPVEKFAILYENLGIKVDYKIIEAAVSACTIDKMKKSEKIYVTYNPRINRSYFVGKEGKLRKDDILTEEIKKYIFDKANDLIKIFYPELPHQ